MSSLMNNSGIFRSGAICTIFEALGGGGTYDPSLNFKTRRKPCCCRHFLFVFVLLSTLSQFQPLVMFLSPFLLSYVAVSRPCHLYEFYPNRASYVRSVHLKSPCLFGVMLGFLSCSTRSTIFFFSNME